MGHNFKYSTPSEATTKLRELGFDKDFSIKDGFFYAGSEKFGVEEMKIAYVSRYEGNSDPGDEATVYGLETKTGVKGILVTGDGIYSDTNSTSLLKKLHLTKLDGYNDIAGDHS